MKFIMEAWRGRKSLALVFWGYFLGFQIAFIIFVLTVLPLFPKPSSAPAAAITTIAFSLFVLSYIVWIYVSMWRCAANSKPVYKIIARIFVVMAVAGTIGKMAVTGIEGYSEYSVAAKQHQINTAMESTTGGEWKQEQLNEDFMRSITKNTCVEKTVLSIEKCSTTQCVTTLGGILGDCIVFAKCSMPEFCKNYEEKYLSQFCTESDVKDTKCLFFQTAEKSLCGKSKSIM